MPSFMKIVSAIQKLIGGTHTHPPRCPHKRTLLSFFKKKGKKFENGHKTGHKFTNVREGNL